jgi:hypothetical protein
MLRNNCAASAAATALCIALAGCGGGGAAGPSVPTSGVSTSSTPAAASSGASLTLAGTLDQTWTDLTGAAAPPPVNATVQATANVTPAGAGYGITLSHTVTANGVPATTVISATETPGSGGLVRSALDVTQSGLTASLSLQQQLGATAASVPATYAISPAFAGHESNATFATDITRSADGSYAQSLTATSGSSAALAVHADLSATASSGSTAVSVAAPSAGTCGVDASPATATLTIAAGGRSTSLTCWYPNPGQQLVSVAGEPPIPSDTRSGMPLATQSVQVTSSSNPCSHGPATVRSTVERATSLDPLLGTYEERVISLYADPSATLLCYRSDDYFFSAYDYSGGALPRYHPLVVATHEALEVTGTSGTPVGNLALALDWPPADLPLNTALTDPIRAAVLRAVGR